MKNEHNNNEEQPLFKSMSKKIETRSMPKSNREETPEDYQDAFDHIKTNLKENKN